MLGVINVRMKVKNMVQEQQKQGISFMQTAISNKKMTNDFLTGGAALLLAIVASLFHNNFLICLFSILSLVLSGSSIVAKFLKKTKKTGHEDTIFILIAVLIPFFTGSFAISAMALALYKLFGILVAYVRNSLCQSLRDVSDVCPQYANLVEYGSDIKRVFSQSLKRDDIIMVKAGETVPVDCIVLEGFAEFDTSKVCRSDVYVTTSSGDKLLAGYVNASPSSVTCRAICDYEESLVMDLNRLASMAESKCTKGEKRLLTIAKWYPIAALVLAVVTLLVGGFASGVWSGAMQRVSIFFVVATTGSYVVAVPLLSTCAVWNLKKRGLALADGEMLDEIADINCVAFEKNGVLTDGEYKIKDIYTAEGISEEDFLMIAANCIGDKQHPISRILTKYMNPYIPAENLLEFPGKGAECTIMGKSFLCGSENFMKECNVDVSEIPGYTIYVSIDGVIMGAMVAQDLVKPNSGAGLRKLRQMGVEKLIMLSSERKETAELVYADCGADVYHAELTPYGRVEVIQNLQKDDDVTCAYIGDSVNCQQAIEEANVGLTHIHKDCNNLEYAKGVLLGDLETVADAIEVSRLVSSKIELHFYCASAVKIILALLGLFGAVNVAAAIVIDALLTIVALLSAKEFFRK